MNNKSYTTFSITPEFSLPCTSILHQ